MNNTGIAPAYRLPRKRKIRGNGATAISTLRRYGQNRYSPDTPAKNARPQPPPRIEFSGKFNNTARRAYRLGVAFGQTEFLAWLPSVRGGLEREWMRCQRPSPSRSSISSMTQSVKCSEGDQSDRCETRELTPQPCQRIGLGLPSRQTRAAARTRSRYRARAGLLQPNKYKKRSHDDAMDQWLVHGRDGEVTQKVASHPPDGKEDDINSNDPPKRSNAT